MELKLKTTELQEMVGKAIKCVSNNKLIPLTSLMSLKVTGNIFTITTTDATNYFYVSAVDKVACDDFEVSVIADIFTKLIQKTSSENVTLNIEGNILKVSGNGTYTMELPLDENGSVIKFPTKFDTTMPPAVDCVIKGTTVKNIITVNKASLAEDMKLPVLTCYYCGDSVITSDRKKICRNDIKTFNKPLLLTSIQMELLNTVSSENINVSFIDNFVLFAGENDTIYAPVTEGVETFPVAAINKLADQDFESVCKVSRSAVVDLIDRLSLFVEKYDKNSIYLTFNNDGILFSSRKSSGQELVPFVSSDNFKPYTCCINIDMLKSQVMTHDSDELEISYGSSVAIKLTNKNVTQIIALFEDDRAEA